eukprot:tig00020564_g11430.t1
MLKNFDSLRSLLTRVYVTDHAMELDVPRPAFLEVRDEAKEAEPESTGKLTRPSAIVMELTSEAVRNYVRVQSSRLRFEW